MVEVSVLENGLRVYDSIESKRRFVLAFKRYTDFSWRDLLEFLQQEFEIGEEEEEELAGVFIPAVNYRSDDEKKWHQLLQIVGEPKLPHELNQLENWLNKYSPGTWRKLLDDTLKVQSSQSCTDQQTRLFLVLHSLLSTEDLMIAWEYEFDDGKSEDLKQKIHGKHKLVMEREGFGNFSEYADRLADGVLTDSEYIEARKWVERYAPHAMNAAMLTKTGFRILIMRPGDSKNTGKSAKVAATSQAGSFPQHIDLTCRTSSIMSIASILAEPIQELDTRLSSLTVLSQVDTPIGSYTETLQVLVPVARMVPLSEDESNDEKEDVNVNLVPANSSYALQDSHLNASTQEWTPVNQPVTRRSYMAAELESPPAPFVCEFCGQGYTQRTSMLAHIRKEHRPKMVQGEQSHNFGNCMGCDTVFSSEDHMLHHTCELRVEEKVPAELDAGYFANVIAEVEAAKIQASNDYTSLMCDICGRVFSSENHLLERPCEHLIEQLWSSPLSSTPLQSQESQSDMEMDEVSDILEGSQQIPTAADRTNLLENQIISGVGIYDKTTPIHAERATLRRAGARFRCDLCRKLFRYQGTLARHHRLMHSLDKPIKCTECDEVFQNLRQRTHHHRVVHLGKKEFSCKECSKSFLQKYRLDRHHRVVHLGENALMCEWCSRSFTYKSSLSRHIKSCRLRQTAASEG